MNPGRFYMPRMGANFSPMMRANFMPARTGIGFFGRIANSLKAFNWSGLLNGANKTLNVVNQTIPLVRQASPMFNNMKSMLRVARAFGSETNKKSSNIRNSNNKPMNNSNNVDKVNDEKKIIDAEYVNQKKEVTNNNYPNFFV